MAFAISYAAGFTSLLMDQRRAGSRSMISSEMRQRCLMPRPPPKMMSPSSCIPPARRPTEGVMLTHGNFWWADINAMLGADFSEHDISIVMAPLFHIGGLNTNALVTWQKGGHIILHRSFDPARFLADVARYRVTGTFCCARHAAVRRPAPGFRHCRLVEPAGWLSPAVRPYLNTLLRLYNVGAGALR